MNTNREEIVNKKKQRAEQLCKIIEDYFNENHFAPSFRELGELLNINSTATTYKRLAEAKELGYINYEESQPRTITLNGFKYILEKEN